MKMFKNTDDNIKIPHYVLDMNQKPKSRIKPETALIIVGIAMLICFAGFVWALFEGKLIDKLL